MKDKPYKEIYKDNHIQYTPPSESMGHFPPPPPPAPTPSGILDKFTEGARVLFKQGGATGDFLLRSVVSRIRFS